LAQRARAAGDRAAMALWSMSSGVDVRADVAGMVAAVAARLPVLTRKEPTIRPLGRPKRATRPRVVALRSYRLAMPLFALLLGCGRRATHADCQLIVDRSVEIQLRAQDETDAKAIAKREAEIRAELDDDIKSCERDRRVTDKMMACVQSASTTAELDKCLR
jgi:hypothetical protein